MQPYVLFFMRLCKQSKKWKDVPQHYMIKHYINAEKHTIKTESANGLVYRVLVGKPEG
jgi:hypothetical protein